MKSKNCFKSKYESKFRIVSKNINRSLYGSGPKNQEIPNVKLIFLRWLRFGRTQNKPEEQKYIREAVGNNSAEEGGRNNERDPINAGWNIRGK